MRSTRAALGALVSAAVVLAGCGSSTSSSPQHTTAPIQIGFIGTFSGPYALSTVGFEDALQTWAHSVDATGGILGRRVEVASRDDQGSSQTALTEAKQLVQSGVTTIVGPVVNAGALQPLGKQAGFVQYAVVSDDKLSNASNFPDTFNTYPQTRLEVAKIGQAAAAKGLKKWAILSDSSDAQPASSMVSEAHKVGADVVLDQSISPTSTPAQYTGAVSSSGADAIMLLTGSQSSAGVLGAMASASLSQPVYAVSTVASSDLSAVSQQYLLSKVNVSVPKSAVLQSGKPISGFIPLTNALYQKYGKASVRSWGMTVDFDTFEMIKYAIQQAGGTNPGSMRQVMVSDVQARSFLSPQVQWTFTSTDHGGYPNSPSDLDIVHPVMSGTWPGYYGTTG